VLLLLGIALFGFAVYGYVITKPNDTSGYAFSFICMAFGLFVSLAGIGVCRRVRWPAVVLAILSAILLVPLLIVPNHDVARMTIIAFFMVVLGGAVLSSWLLSRSSSA
jgi:hypothetical protein